MTNLSEEQKARLQAVEDARREVEADLDTLRRQQEQERWEIQQPLILAAKAAADAGVPARQIGFALRTSDHKTIKKYTSGDVSVQDVGD